MRKYYVSDWSHMNTTSIKKYEQEAISLFRTEVAPAFVFNSHHRFGNETNRFRRVCEFCNHMYNERYVLDAMHVLFKCPMVAKERAMFFNVLDTKCGAFEWARVANLYDLGVSLLTPQSVDVACAVGRFLSEYLAAREILLSSLPFSSPPKQVTKSRWLGSRTNKLEEIRLFIHDSLHERANTETSLRFATCSFSNTWINQHSFETLHDAFKLVRSWLPDGWEQRIGRKSKPPTRSVACL